MRISSSLWERCELPPTFSELRSFFLQLCQHHFSNAANYGIYEDQLKCLTFNPEDPDNSELPVKLAFGSPSTGGSGPGVLIYLQDFKFESRAIGMEHGYSEDYSTIITTKKAVGSLRISVEHPSPEIAHLLAESLVIFLETTRIYWMEPFHLEQCHVVSLEGIERRSNAPENLYRTVVSVLIQGPIIMALAQESLRLKKVKVELTPT